MVKVQSVKCLYIGLFPAAEAVCQADQEKGIWEKNKPGIVCLLLVVFAIFMVCTPMQFDALCEECQSCWTGRWTGCNLFTRGFCKFSSHSCSGGVFSCAGKCLKYLLWPFYSN